MTSFHQDWFNRLSINQRIAERDGSLYHKLVNFATSMEPVLDHEPAYKPIAYTPHDFQHHIKNVLGNMSALLEGRLDLFSIEELFCLQCACIVHDIDMAYNPDGRPIHMFNGSAIINDRFKHDMFGTDGDLKESLEIFEGVGTVGASDATEFAYKISTKLAGFVSFLMHENAMYTEAISWIVLGHSDIKLQESVITTLELDCYDMMEKIVSDPSGKVFHLRAMSALLRWADELDCSQKRLPSTDLEPINEESKPHWDKLHIIRAVKINGQHVELMLDDRDFEVESDEPYELLYQRLEKLNRERTTINNCFKRILFDYVIADLSDEQLICDSKIKMRYQTYKDQKKKPSTSSGFR